MRLRRFPFSALLRLALLALGLGLAARLPAAEPAADAPAPLPDAVGGVIVLVHGVNSGPATYARFRDRVWARALAGTALIELNWGREHCVHASGSVGERPNLVIGMSNQAWVGVAKLKDVVAQCRAALGPEVPITVVGHSQGAVIAVAALQEGLRVDHLVMLGSTLGTESVRTGARNTRLGEAARHVSGKLVNLWSPSDQTVQTYKGGIGGFGLPSPLPDLTTDNVADVRITNVDHAGDDGWWSSVWLLPGFRGQWRGMTRDGYLALLRGGEPRPLEPPARAALARAQDYARRDTHAGWFGNGDADALAYTFTLTPGLMNGIHFGDKDWCRATVRCLEGTVRWRIQAAPWSRFDRGTAWATLAAGETGTAEYTVERWAGDAMVFLQVENPGNALARVECAFEARDR